MEVNNLETILNIKDQLEVNEMVEFIKSLNSQEQRQINALIQGVKLGMLFGKTDEAKGTA